MLRFASVKKLLPSSAAENISEQGEEEVLWSGTGRFSVQEEEWPLPVAQTLSVQMKEGLESSGLANCNARKKEFFLCSDGRFGHSAGPTLSPAVTRVVRRGSCLLLLLVA